MLRQQHHVEGINNSVRFYISSRMADESQFPFDPGDEFYAVIVDGVLVIAQPDAVPDQIKIPPALQP